MDPFVGALFVMLLMDDEQYNRAHYYLFASGILASIVVLLKYSAAPIMLFPFMLIIRRCFGKGRWLQSILFYIAGLSLPAFALLIYLWQADALKAFLDATLNFNLMHRQIASVKITEGIFGKIIFEPLYFLPLYMFPIMVFLRRFNRQNDDSKNSIFVSEGILLWILSLIEVFWQKKFWYYHFHVVLLPLCLMAGAGLCEFQRVLEKRLSKSGTLIILILMTVLLCVPNIAFEYSYLHYHDLIGYFKGRTSRQTFLSTYVVNDYNYLETEMIASRIKQETGPDDYIFVWGFEPYVYCLAQRRPASRFLYDYPLMKTFRLRQKQYPAYLMNDLEKHRPAWFLVLQGDQNAIEKLDSESQLNHFETLKKFLDHNYRLYLRSQRFLCYKIRQ